jgi:FtsH-binding integral membrane protein
MGFYDRDLTQEKDKLATFSSRVYGWMAIGLGLTALIAYAVYSSGIYVKLMPFWWVWSFGTLGVAMAINFSIQRISIQGAIGLFLTYAGLEGILFGTILPAFAAAYGGQMIWSAFATASVIFGLAMGYGMFTKSDLTTMGRILSFGLIGLIALSLLFFILSFFMPMGLANLLISYLGLVIFVGLTAYDAQTIRQMSMQVRDNETVASYKMSLIMALKMYINVIMIFWYLLQIFSSSSSRR